MKMPRSCVEEYRLRPRRIDPLFTLPQGTDDYVWPGFSTPGTLPPNPNQIARYTGTGKAGQC
jgi:hypothetical protein